MERLLCLLAGYVCGGFLTAELVARHCTGKSAAYMGTGNPGMAKGGSGDVLTGTIVSLLAQGASPVQAAAGGVWLHGRAGDLAAARLTAYGMTPEDVVSSLPAAIGEAMA